MKTRLQQAFFNSSQGPQHREIGFPISTDNASWGVGPNTENFEKKFYRQCELGCGPQHREIGFPISTDNASWRGPNKEKLDSQFLQTVRVGVGQRNKFCENIISVPLP
ncbi:hypothetical protein GP483_09445 [Staphylococcus aureus]|nr:hypothetical protein [Staphylococcus aureus]